MKHRLQGDKKTLRLRQGFRLCAYERFAETSRRDRLQAMDEKLSFSSSRPQKANDIFILGFPGDRERRIAKTILYIYLCPGCKKNPDEFGIFCLPCSPFC